MGAIYDVVASNSLYTVDENTSVGEAARRMAEHNIGAMPVVREQELTGIFSERDIMKRVVAAGLDPEQTLVREVMTSRVLSVGRHESIENCMILMKTHGVRHLPIIDDGRLIGMASLRDVLLYEVDEMDGEVRAMRAYMQSSM